GLGADFLAARRPRADQAVQEGRKEARQEALAAGRSGPRVRSTDPLLPGVEPGDGTNRRREVGLGCLVRPRIGARSEFAGDRLAAREALVHSMPVFDLGLAQLPTKQHFAAG